MDSLVLAFWLTPGYIFLWFWSKIVPYHRKGSDWTFIAPIAIWSLIFFLISRILRFFISTIEEVDYFRLWWHRNITIANSLSLATACLVSVLAGLLICYIGVPILKKFSFGVKILKFFGYLKFPDEISRYLYSLFDQEIILSTNSGKFYIGVLISASTDENENDKAIVIKPSWSGYRKVDDHSVIFDTFYSKHDEMQETQNDNDLELMFLLSSIVSIGKFDRQLHKYFLQTGKTTMKLGGFSK